MRKIAAAAVAIPFILFYLIIGLLRQVTRGHSIPALQGRFSRPRLPQSQVTRSGLLQGAVIAGAVAMVVTALLIGLPAKKVAGSAPASLSPLAPQGEVIRNQTNLPLDVAFKIQFTKPMNENSVQGATTITPDIDVLFLWDPTGQILSIKPTTHWQPYSHYMIDMTPAATDQEGLGLAAPIDTSFDSGSPTSGVIAATQVSDGLASPGTAFQLTFTRPVKLATVVTRFGISPQVPFNISGNDPTDMASQVFTMTPKDALSASVTYTVTFALGSGNSQAQDSAGAPISSVPALVIKTMTAPTVVRFRPQDGYSYDTNQPVSVRFTMSMDTKSTEAAFSVTSGGKPVAGKLTWSENNTVLLLTPRYSFKVGAVVVAKVGPGARSATGLHLAGSASSTFKITTPQVQTIAWTGASGSGSAQWYSFEVYYLNLMNCTRSGRWVTDSGNCSTVTHHTLPAPGNLIRLNADISNRVSRPYAKYMADHRLLDHFLNGTTPHSRLCAAGYCGSSWGENIASPCCISTGGMIDIEIFYQNEYVCACEHYYNIMDRYFSQAGIGVWYSNSVRVSIDFYG